MKQTERLQQTWKMRFENILEGGGGQSTEIATVQKRAGGFGNREHTPSLPSIWNAICVSGDRLEPG